MKSRNVQLLTAIAFLLYFLPSAPVAVIYYQSITQSFAMAMAVFAVDRAVMTVCEIPTGILSDYIGRRGVLICGTVARVCAYPLLAVATTTLPLFAGAALIGFANALFSGNNDALLFDTLKDEGKEREYATHYGRTQSALQIGLATSALLATGLSFLSLRSTFTATIFSQCIALIAAFFIREPKAHSHRIQENVFAFLRDASKKFRENAVLRTYATGHAIGIGVSNALFIYTPAFFSTLWPVWTVGFIRAFAGLFASISFWLAGPLLKRQSSSRVLIGGHLAARTLNLIASGIPSVVSPLLVTLTSLFFGVRVVAEQTLLQEQFTDRQRATLGSLTSFAGSILFVIVATMVGLLADAFGPARALFIGELFFLPAIVLYMLIAYKKRRPSGAPL